MEQWFQTPPDDHRGTDFWMLNDKLEDAELIAQLRRMKEQGIASIIVRTYIGLQSDYPGPGFMAKMRTVVDEARALGMELFMQAGYMPEAVLDLPPAYSLQSVNPYPVGQEQGTVLHAHGGIRYCLEPTGTILDMLSPEACRFYVKQSYEDMWAAFKADFGKTIVSMWVDEPSYAHAKLPWTDALPAAYEALWGAPFPLAQLHLLFEDGAGAETIRHRYWRTVLRLMKDAYFTEVRAWCQENGLLFSGHLMAEDTMAAQIRATCFTMPMYRYFDMPGIDYLTCAMNWRHGEIKPAGGQLERPIALYTTALQCTSAAHQAGQDRILCEMYGVSTQNLTLRDQKHLYDRFVAMGINHRSVHGIFYSLRGRGKRAYPPHVNAYQPYWPKYRLLTDVVAREAAFIRRGLPVRDVLVMHPMDSAFCEYTPRMWEKDAPAPYGETLRRRDRAFFELLSTLSGAQINYELGDEESMAEFGSLAGHELQLGAMRYRTLVLPDMRSIRESTLSLLEAFAAAGGQVVLLGEVPALLDGQPHAGLPARVRALPGLMICEDLSALCAQLALLPARYQYRALDDGSRVQINYREDGARRLIYLMNIDCREGRKGILRVPGAFDAHSLDASSGEATAMASSHDADGTEVPVALPEGGALMLLLTPRTAAGQASAPSEAPTVHVHVDLAGPWQIARQDPNVLVLEFARYQIDAEPFGEKYPILGIQALLTERDYRGPIALQYEFEADVPLVGAKLALERPEAMEILLDGRPLAAKPAGYYRAFAFETIELPALSAGKHTIELRARFQPVGKAKSGVTSLFENLGGLELEPLMLLGDFAVRSVIEPGIDGCVRFHPHFRLGSESIEGEGELTRMGYPFYAGAMRLSKRFHAPGPGKVALRLEGMHAAACEAFVNGQSVGHFLWAPYELDISAFVRAGENELMLVLYNTMRNLLGPWHRPVGEIGACWSGYGQPNKPWLGAGEGEGQETWMRTRMPDQPNWTERYLILPLGVVKAHLIYTTNQWQKTMRTEDA